jgi:UDP-N-acetylmuramoyl-L-alanyl-D-glutamate--2,6-diaminopimelate ligase
MTTEAGAAPDVRRTYAVVGSTGKATTCYLLEHVLAALGRSTALFSTVEVIVGAERTPVERGEQPDIMDLIARSDAALIDDTILELRWPELQSGVVQARPIDVAVFTHLDPDVEADGVHARLDLAAAALGRAGRALVLVDDDAGAALAARVPGSITIGTRSRGPDADWQVSVNASRVDHIDFTITHRSGRSVSTSLWIPTRFSVAFAALALVAVMETGVGGSTIARVLPHGMRPVVPGRVQRVADHPRCVVDVSHNPFRLARVLDPLRRTTRGKLVVVVGARAGDSPQTRRDIGAAAAHADSVVVTDDDWGPGDDPAAIRADVIAGARAAGCRSVAEVSPRSAAIRTAVALADRDDTVLVAGRGHLTWLQSGDARVHLDDREEVRAGIAAREGRHAGAG